MGNSYATQTELKSESAGNRAISCREREPPVTGKRKRRDGQRRLKAKRTREAVEGRIALVGR
jgi:hypothetical protein